MEGFYIKSRARKQWKDNAHIRAWRKDEEVIISGLETEL